MERATLIEEGKNWLTLRFAQELLHQARAWYEETHQPEIIGRAQKLFLDWTQGEFKALELENGMLNEVQRSDDGSRVPLIGLSRGTKEALYLSLRLAFIEYLAKDSEPLPIVMDETLVDFDANKTERIARSLEAFSKHHQIIYLTCHPNSNIIADRKIPLQV